MRLRTAALSAACLLLALLLAAPAATQAARPRLFDRLRAPAPGTAVGAAFINLHPSAVSYDTDAVTVTWGGVASPKETDVMSMFLYTDTEDKDHFIGYYNVTQAADWRSGSGSLKIPIFFPRDHAFYFEYTRADDKVVTTSAALPASNPTHASQLHLSLTHDPSEMQLMFVTTAAAAAVFDVQYSPTPFPDDVASHSLAVARARSHPAWARAGKVVTREAAAVWAAGIDADVDTVSDNEEAGASVSGATTEGLVLAVRAVPAADKGTYTRDMMCAEPATKKGSFVGPGRSRLAVMTDLVAGTRYFYRVVDVNGAVVSRTYSFVAAPAAGSHDSVDIIAFGDLGTPADFNTDVLMQNDAQGTLDGITRFIENLKGRFTAVVHVGDLSYANGRGTIWELFMRSIEPLAARVPWMVTLGNHESIYLEQPFKPSWSDYKKDSGGECSVPTTFHFRMPPNFVVPSLAHTVAPGETPKWLAGATGNDEGEDDYTDLPNVAYSFEIGPVHFTLFSSEHNFLPGSKQHAFITADLVAVDRKRTPWVVVGAHRPLYCSTEGCTVDARDNKGKIVDHLRDVYEPIFAKHNVNMGLFGHFHDYERSCQMSANFTCAAPPGAHFLAADGPVHVIIGMAGNSHNENWANYHPKAPGLVKTAVHQQPDWVMFRSMSFGYTHINANATHMTTRFIGARTGVIHDEFILEQ